RRAAPAILRGGLSAWPRPVDLGSGNELGGAGAGLNTDRRKQVDQPPKRQERQEDLRVFLAFLALWRFQFLLLPRRACVCYYSSLREQLQKIRLSFDMNQRLRFTTFALLLVAVVACNSKPNDNAAAKNAAPVGSAAPSTPTAPPAQG